MTQSHVNGPIVGAPASAPTIAPPEYAGQPATAVDMGSGVVARLKLSEPVRLYLYGIVGLVLVPGLVLAGILTGDWPAYVISSAAIVLGVGGATEAARASTYSLRTHLRQLAGVGRGVDAGAFAKALDL